MPIAIATDPTSTSTLSVEASSVAQDETQRQKQQQTDTGNYVFKEMPYTFISPNEPIVERCMQVFFQCLFEGTLTCGCFHRQQFSILPDFPSSNLLVRNPAGEPARSLYVTNDLVRAVLTANDYKRIRIMTAGTKIFTRQEGGFGRGGGGEDGDEKIPRFRLLSEGLPVVLPYIKPETILDTGIPALRRLLETYYPLLNAFNEAFQRDVGSRRTCPPSLASPMTFSWVTNSVGATC
jgi:multisite-specific tRNA:(cytosine-C5)-methyltransferase